MRTSLALKLIGAFLAVSLIGTLILALLAVRTTTNEFSQFVFARGQELFVDDLAEHYRANNSWQGVEKILPGRGQGMGPWRSPGGLVALADEQGNVIVPGAGRHAGDQLPPAEADRGIAIQVDGQTVGTLIAGPIPVRANPPEGAFLTRVNQALLWASLGATAVALILGIFLARALTRPIGELTAATRSVAEGNLGHQVEVRSRDELGELAASFNQMSADLARSSKLRRQMTADIAHDLRTPISVILGHAEALADGVMPPVPETFHIIHDESMRLNRLVEDLRTLSLAETGELPLVLRLTSPQAMLERAVTTHATQAQQREISLKVEGSSDLLDVNVDPDRMAQVLDNLLDNALRHTPDGGRITLAAEQQDGRVRLSVQDSGSGIAPEDLPRLFDRFYRADKSRRRHDGGSGLGLAIARSIVMRHGGRIWAESHLGQGAGFIIELPASETNGRESVE